MVERRVEDSIARMKKIVAKVMSTKIKIYSYLNAKTFLICSRLDRFEKIDR